MKIKTNSGIVIFVKLYIFGVVAFALIRVIDMSISLISKEYIPKISIGLEIWGVILTSLVISLISLPSYLHIVKAIRMDDQTSSTELVTRAMDKMKWKIVSQTETEIIFISSFLFPSWSERIIIRFTDTEIQIGGPREYVERAITLSNFPYGAFEISNFE